MKSEVTRLMSVAVRIPDGSRHGSTLKMKTKTTEQKPFSIVMSCTRALSPLRIDFERVELTLPPPGKGKENEGVLHTRFQIGVL